VIAGGVTPGGGEHPELRRLRATADHLGVSDRVRLVGQVPRAEASALIRSADVVVSAAWYEPFGMVPLEAMACGVPVVASAVGGHLDTVEPGRTGLLVPPGDVAALQQALRQLLGSQRLREALGAIAAEKARERYGWGRIAADTESTYRAVADRRVLDEAPGASGVALPELAKGT
jgi:D-inositol-3-phosphate glycosyltransferase